MDSILDDIKKMNGISPDHTEFDTDLKILINAAIGSLQQLGVGPENGYKVESRADEWSAIIGDRLDLEMTKEYIYLKTRPIFNPPSTSFALNAIDEAAKELEWRLYVQGGDHDG